MPTCQPLVVLKQTGEVRCWFSPRTEGYIHTDSNSDLLDGDTKHLYWFYSIILTYQYNSNTELADMLVFTIFYFDLYYYEKYFYRILRTNHHWIRFNTFLIHTLQQCLGWIVLNGRYTCAAWVIVAHLFPQCFYYGPLSDLSPTTTGFTQYPMIQIYQHSALY